MVNDSLIIFQENNAIATVDLVKGEIIDIHPLGSKAWEGLKMDISDKDGGELKDVLLFYL